MISSMVHEEMQYLNLCRKVIEMGNKRTDRTGVGTHSIFGAQMRFDLREQFPLLTTKQVIWKSVALELLWILSGSTNAMKLDEQGVKIWNANSSKEFLTSQGFPDREVGDLGPVYGFQWRHFGAKYVDCFRDYKNEGVDQIKTIINQIKSTPNSRRIVLSAWNPCDFNQMVLPPCHVLCQFYVNGNELSSHLYQRSGDLGLGIPFNIASYSLLTCMIAHPSEFIHSIGDAHVYNDHIDALKLQIDRTPYPFPKLKIIRNVTDIDDFSFNDFELLNYKHHPRIKMNMAV